MDPWWSLAIMVCGFQAALFSLFLALNPSRKELRKLRRDNQRLRRRNLALERRYTNRQGASDVRAGMDVSEFLSSR